MLSRGMHSRGGPVSLPHVRIRGRAMRTNTPPNGAFRGFGAPQTQFGVEVHMDRIADALGIDPVQLREMNAFKPGDTTATGQMLPADDAARCRCCAKRCRRTSFKRKRRAMAGHGQRHRTVALLSRRGLHRQRRSQAGVESVARVDGDRRRAFSSRSTEIGQGTRTMHAQIVADALGMPYDAVECHEADTALVPDSGPTVASRTCMVVGRLLERRAAR